MFLRIARSRLRPCIQLRPIHQQRTLFQSSKNLLNSVPQKERKSPFNSLSPEISPVLPNKKRTRIRSVDSDSVAATVVPDVQKSKVNAVCTAEGYSMDKLAEDILHIRLQTPIEAVLLNSETDVVKEADYIPEAFIFANGSFVSWGASDEENDKLAQVLRMVDLNRYKESETEWFNYVVEASQTGGLSGDTIIIGNELPQSEAKLAFSAGLSRSVKLGSLETKLHLHIDKNRDIPEFLLKGKRLPISRSAILRNLGELFSLRGHVNLHSELLDSPDFLWESQKMEEYFTQISRNLDVRVRIAVFNKKLDYANELSEVLRNHMHEQWYIIILIVVEIMFEFVHFAERLFPASAVTLMAETPEEK